MSDAPSHVVICDAGSGFVYATTRRAATAELARWEFDAAHSIGRSQEVATSVVEFLKKRIKEVDERERLRNK